MLNSKAFGHPLLTCPTFLLHQQHCYTYEFVTELSIDFDNEISITSKRKTNFKCPISTFTKVQTPGKVLLKDNEQKKTA